MKMAEAKAAETTKLLLEIFIKATPERLWQAITDGSITEKYYFGGKAQSDWKTGSEYKYVSAEGKAMIAGKVIESDPPRKLVTTFIPLYDGSDDPPTSRVTYEITPMGEACKLALTHDELVAGDPVNEQFRGGWANILSGLKTFVETGEPLVVTPPKVD